MYVRNLAESESFITADRSSIRELTNTGSGPLVLLCCCAPGYSHEDTVLTELESDPARLESATPEPAVRSDPR